MINGKSFGKWSQNSGFSDGYETIFVESGKTYRFRVIGAGIDSILTFEIEGHQMQIIEVSKL